MTTPAPSTAGPSREDRMQKLKDLAAKRHDARKLNHQEVVAEDKRKSLPGNWEHKRRRLEWEEKDDQFKQECESKGVNPDRMRMLEVTAETADKLETRKRRRANADTGFASYEESSVRKYQTLCRQLRPDMRAYAEEKARMGEERFYPTSSTLGVADRKDDPRAVDRMAQDVAQQVAKRKNYSRRRAFDEDADVDYINDRNMRYNRKLERAFGQYTAEIKQNLERGTAI